MRCGCSEMYLLPVSADLRAKVPEGRPGGAFEKRSRIARALTVTSAVLNVVLDASPQWTALYQRDVKNFSATTLGTKGPQWQNEGRELHSEARW
mmetsp:Transcript_133682/g.260305  ORF Transcript_133682/g.260305 Transcript_133682/m.260305 type:complete len:94 (-) Transcript_133682:32-313(-)